VGSVLYGSEGIYDCAVVGDMALTFDDGPYIYTSHILDLLLQYNASATFFITGNNNGMLHCLESLDAIQLIPNHRQRLNRQR
jgi:peptidoglycan/xylan/chitin deacetylase (PgdA/CDA1 family)